MSTSKGLEKLGFDPDNDFILRDDSDGQGVRLIWNSSNPQPSDAEIEAARAEWQAEHDAQEYSRNRQAEYPPVDELVIALWEAVIEERMASSIAIQNKRTAIKEKYPK